MIFILFDYPGADGEKTGSEGKPETAEPSRIAFFQYIGKFTNNLNPGMVRAGRRWRAMTRPGKL
jgi:hypothetical protein